LEENPSVARDLLAQAAGEKLVGVAGEMRVRKFLQGKFDRALSFREFSEVEAHAVLGVLLEYFTSRLDGAMTKMKNVVESLRGRELIGTVTHERVLMSVSRLLYHHARVQGWYRPSILRDFWMEAISIFPNNTAFLSLFTWNEANSRIDGRVRKVLTTLDKSVNTWIFTIWTEISIERGRVSEFAVRSLFEKAVDSEM